MLLPAISNQPPFQPVFLSIQNIWFKSCYSRTAEYRTRNIEGRSTSFIILRFLVHYSIFAFSTLSEAGMPGSWEAAYRLQLIANSYPPTLVSPSNPRTLPFPSNPCITLGPSNPAVTPGCHLSYRTTLVLRTLFIVATVRL